MFQSQAVLTSTSELGQFARGLEGLSKLGKPSAALSSTLHDPIPLGEEQEAIGGEGNLRFKVTRVSSAGIQELRFIELNVSSSTIRFLQQKSSISSKAVYSSEILVISQISQMDRCASDPHRLLLMFFGAVQDPLDLIFMDKATRDIFCDMIVSLNPGIVQKASHLLRIANWIPDKSAKKCMRCLKKFNLSTRKHHCRSCGYVVCSDCSEHVAVLPNMGYNSPVRVCDACFISITDARVNENVGQTPSKNVAKGFTEFKADSTESDKDKYGFPLINRVEQLRSTYKDDEKEKQDNADKLLRFEEDYRLVLEKQRVDWNRYLALHPVISDSDSELKDLLRKGIPPELRGSLWQILCNSHKMNDSAVDSYYEDLIKKAEADKKFLEDIEKDLHRTFPSHAKFGTSEGLFVLRRVLLAFSMHNPTVGYCQSMNFICALLLLFMDEQNAFWTLVAIVDQLTSFDGLFYYQQDLAGVRIDQYVFGHLLKENLPKIHQKLEDLNMSIEPLSVNWFLCLFVNCVPLETTLRIWDVFFFEGTRMLFRAGLALLKLNQNLILKAKSCDQLMTFLRAFTKSALDCDHFIQTCFDSNMIGSVSKRRILELRARYRQEVLSKNEDARNRSSDSLIDSQSKTYSEENTEALLRSYHDMASLIQEEQYNLSESRSRHTPPSKKYPLSSLTIPQISISSEESSSPNVRSDASSRASALISALARCLENSK